MKIIDEIDESFESEYDKSTYEQGAKLLLCEYCQKEYYCRPTNNLSTFSLD